MRGALSSRSSQSSSKSSIVVLNRKNPKMEPWGQPPDTGKGSEREPPTLTVIERFVKKVAMRRRTSVEAPFFASDFKQNWYDIQLNAFE